LVIFVPKIIVIELCMSRL